MIPVQRCRNQKNREVALDEKILSSSCSVVPVSLGSVVTEVLEVESDLLERPIDTKQSVVAYITFRQLGQEHAAVTSLCNTNKSTCASIQDQNISLRISNVTL
jgi:hypothetical protein